MSTFTPTWKPEPRTVTVEPLGFRPVSGVTPKPRSPAHICAIAIVPVVHWSPAHATSLPSGCARTVPPPGPVQAFPTYISPLVPKLSSRPPPVRNLANVGLGNPAGLSE